MPRPAGEPGNQTFIAEVPQAGCVAAAANSSAYVAAALLARCHPAGRMALVDYALAGAVVGVSQNPLPAYYNVVLKNMCVRLLFVPNHLRQGRAAGSFLHPKQPARVA